MSSYRVLHHTCREGVEPAADHPIELPEFTIRALEHRVEMTNAGADEEEMVSFNDVVEWYLLSPLSVKEMPHLEFAVPGFTAALVRWMIEATYNGPE